MTALETLECCQCGELFDGQRPTHLPPLCFRCAVQGPKPIPQCGHNPYTPDGRCAQCGARVDHHEGEKLCGWCYYPLCALCFDTGEFP